MFGKKSPDVLIVGAGPVGMFAALCLAKRGINVKIVDMEDRNAGHSYALGLHPASLRLFEKMGLLEEIRKKSYRVHTIGLHDPHERRLELHLSQRIDDSYSLAVIPQNALERLLEEALNKNGVQILWSHRLSSLEPSRDTIHVNIDRLEKESMGYAVAHTEWIVDKTLTLDVPFVIGADGYASIVRRQLQINFESVGETLSYAVYEFLSTDDPMHEASLVLDEKSTNVLWPLGNNRCRWSFQLKDVSTSEESRDKERLEIYLGPGLYPWLSEEYLHTLIQDRAPWYKGNVDRVVWGAVVRFERRMADSFGSNRIGLAGDSAHLTGPVGMQSMNVGLREAYDLTSKIADLLSGGGSPESLTDYNEERINEWKTLHGLKGGLRADSETDPWISQYADRLLSCLPGTGVDLAMLARQLKLEFIQEGINVETLG